MAIETFNESIESKLKVKSNIPQIVIKNESSIPKYLSSITLTPDVLFSAYGTVEIQISQRIIVNRNKSGAFKLKETITFNTTNEIINPNEELRIYIWNKKTTDTITGAIGFGLNTEQYTTESSDQARSQLDFNQQLSTHPDTSQGDEKINETLKLVNDAINHLDLDVTLDDADIIAELKKILLNLPISPDNAPIISKLALVISAIGDETVDLHAELVKVRDAVNAENTDLKAKLTTLINAVQEEETKDDNFHINSTSQYIKNILPTTTPLVRVYLNNVQSKLMIFANKVAQNTLDDLINVLNTEIPRIRRYYSKIADTLQTLLTNLLEISETVPILKSVEDTSLFPIHNYRDEIHTALVNMKGSKNLIVLIKATTATLPKIINQTGGNSFDATIVDGVITTYSSLFSSGLDETKEYRVKIDFGSINYRDLHILMAAVDISFYNNINRKPVTYTVFTNVKQSTDNITWINSDKLISMRYANLYIRLVYGPPQGRASVSARVEVKLYEFYDAYRTGGRLELTFEVKNSNNEWFTLIDKSELPIVATGEQKTFVLGKDSTGHILPSSHNLFRAKLTVLGAVSTSISILKIA